MVGDLTSLSSAGVALVGILNNDRISGKVVEDMASLKRTVGLLISAHTGVSIQNPASKVKTVSHPSVLLNFVKYL